MSDGERTNSDAPLEVDVDLSRADWLADVEVAVTPRTPDPLTGHLADGQRHQCSR
jgi:hypothetical protein